MYMKKCLNHCHCEKTKLINVDMKCDKHDTCSCGYDEDNSMPSEPILAQAYVPIQQMSTTFCPEEGLYMGTIFPELVRPYSPYDSLYQDARIREQNIYDKGGCNDGCM